MSELTYTEVRAMNDTDLITAAAFSGDLLTHELANRFDVALEMISEMARAQKKAAS